MSFLEYKKAMSKACGEIVKKLCALKALLAQEMYVLA
jgi:hypothetical protein